MAARISWRVLQLADSAFPTGGFAHSAGLEAALHLGELRTSADLDLYIRSQLWSLGHCSLPFVRETWQRPCELWAMDALMNAVLTNQVANRASRTQGRAFIATCARVFEHPALVELASRARSRKVSAHLAPLFGASLATLAIDCADATALYMHLALRGMTSAAVRLGIVGTHEGQRLLMGHSSTLDVVLGVCGHLTPRESASTAPLLDVFSASHDRLDARLFQS